MTIDYKRELEAAAKGMILIHKPDTLIKLVLRMTVRKARLKHAAALLYNKAKNSYILTDSKGERGCKVPAGFARLEPQLPAYLKQKLEWSNNEVNILQLSIIGRLLYPCSERKTAMWLNENSAAMEIVCPEKSFIHRDPLYDISKKFYKAKSMS